MARWRVVQALPILALFASSGASQDDQIITINVNSGRPLASVIEQIEKRSGQVITYEDPFYLYAADIEDVTLAVRRDGRTEPRVMVPRGGPFFFRYPAAARDQLVVLERLIQEYSLSGHPGVFRLIRTGDVYHVVPSERRNFTGAFEPHASLLDANISVPVGDRTALEMVKAITEAVSSPGVARIAVGTVPLNAMIRTHIQGGAIAESARTALLRTLDAIHSQLSWQLFCDPGPTPVCALNVHDIGH
jgi:hypothetical protein